MVCLGQRTNRVENCSLALTNEYFSLTNFNTLFDIPLWTVCTSIIDQMNSFGAQFGFPLFSWEKKRFDVRIVGLKKFGLHKGKGKSIHSTCRLRTIPINMSGACSYSAALCRKSHSNLWIFGVKSIRKFYVSIISSSSRFLPILFIKVDLITSSEYLKFVKIVQITFVFQRICQNIQIRFSKLLLW